MRSEDAIEIVRASLALAFPGASAEGLARAAEHVVRWGAEGVAEELNPELSQRMLVDLMGLSGFDSADFEPADIRRLEMVRPAPYRIWSRPDHAGDQLPFLRRPPDPDDENARRRRPPRPGAAG
ncbi:hypothetical protein ACIBAG_18740 [Streptomyces sp. NPDC051243]|uniref:hypothetical protein n=1 Tax=Streptomyces sp. NPDC051243 TaxID=3365646 RepID=UPI003791D62A